MINAKKAVCGTIEANNKRKKRACKKVKRQALIWNFLTRRAVAKGQDYAQITYRVRFTNSIFMEEAKLYLESFGYTATYFRHRFDTKYTLRWGWQQ